MTRTNPTRSDRAGGRRTRDEGTVLVLTLLLSVILAAVVLVLATYATTGLATSKVTTERTSSNAAASAAMNWALEEFTKKQLLPEDTADCGASPVALTVPAAIDPAATLAVTCTTQAAIDAHPTVLLSAQSTTDEGMLRSIDAVVQIPAGEYAVQIHSWMAD